VVDAAGIQGATEAGTNYGWNYDGSGLPMKSTILLVDDSRLLRVANRNALIRAGYDVIDAEDGQRGLQLAQERLPDLILLDMMLPKLSGPDVLRALKNDPRTSFIPVVILTGLSPKNKEKLAQEGAADFVEKSDDLLRNDSAILVKAVQKVLLTTAKQTQ
jgi:CheY-like chemotaxis protein